MDQSTNRIRSTVHYLASQVSLGWHYFLVSKFIGEAYQQNRIHGAHTILKNAQLACWESAILAVAKVIDNHKGSLSLDYLLNCIEAEPDAYPLPDKHVLLKQIFNHRKQLVNLQTILPGLWERRNRLYAHLDKRLVKSPDSVFSQPELELDSLHTALRILRGILEVYDKQTEAFSLWVDESKYIWNDLEHLICLIDTSETNHAA